MYRTRLKYLIMTISFQNTASTMAYWTLIFLEAISQDPYHTINTYSHPTKCLPLVAEGNCWWLDNLDNKHTQHLVEKTTTVDTIRNIHISILHYYHMVVNCTTVVYIEYSFLLCLLGLLHLLLAMLYIRRCWWYMNMWTRRNGSITIDTACTHYSGSNTVFVLHIALQPI